MTNQPFETTVHARTNLVIIEMSGLMDATAQEELSMAYAEAIQMNPKLIALNFSNVSYINSSGIAVIVRTMTSARKAGHRLVVFGLNEHYKKIFEITHLSDFMPVFDNEQEVMAAV